MHRSKKSPLPRREGQGEGFPTAACSLRAKALSCQRSAVSSQPDAIVAASTQRKVKTLSDQPLAQTLPARERSKTTASSVVRAFIVAATLLATVGCADHPPLERPSYDLAKALYAVCNRQSTEHLAKFDEVLTEAIAAGKVGPQEEAALRQIAQEAAAGEWYDAQEMARELIAGQNS